MENLLVTDVREISDRIDRDQSYNEGLIFDAALNLALVKALVYGRRVGYIHMGGISPKNYPVMQEVLNERGFGEAEPVMPIRGRPAVWWKIEW